MDISLYCTETKKTIKLSENCLKEELLNLSLGDECFKINDVLKSIKSHIHNKISVTEFLDLLISTTLDRIEEDPIYDKVATKLFFYKIDREFLNDHSLFPKPDKNLLNNKFKENILWGIDKEYFSPCFHEFDLASLASQIQYTYNDTIKYIGIKTLYSRYFIRSDEGQLLENLQSFWMRVAMGLSLEEKDKTSQTLEFYQTMAQLYYIPSTPTLFHSGLIRAQLSSCYINTVQDDLKNIFKCLGDNAVLSKWSGGIGSDWTNIRGTGSLIHTTHIQSQGVIPFLKVANDVTLAISRSGKRRGATCAYLEIWHTDIYGFLDLKRNTGDERRRTHDLNTAVWIPDLFMERVQNNEPWSLFSPSDTPDLHDLYGQAFKERYLYYEKLFAKEVSKRIQIKATDLWKLLLTRMFETGHPWLTFKDACNIRNPQSHVGVIHSSNLCTEITLNTSDEEVAVCNLGSLNLSRFVVDNKYIDNVLLEKTINIAIRMLDNVIDINFYPIQEAKNSNLKHRPIGLGTMGWQDLFFQLNCPMDSPKALAITDSLMEFISFHAISSSAMLAKEKGSYPSFNDSKWSHGIFPIDTLSLLSQNRQEKVQIDTHYTHDWSLFLGKYSHNWHHLKDIVKTTGLRNSNLMANAPTATISNIAGCFPTFEAIYKNIYVKANINGEFTILNQYLVHDLKKKNLWNLDTLNQLKAHDGSIQSMDLDENLKNLYQTIFELDPLHLLFMSAKRSKWIDQSQSHNVFMLGNSGKQLHEIYFYAWKLGLKTTYYLRTLAKSQVEKSTLNSQFGFTQKRDIKEKNAT